MKTCGLDFAVQEEASDLEAAQSDMGCCCWPI